MLLKLNCKISVSHQKYGWTWVCCNNELSKSGNCTVENFGSMLENSFGAWNILCLWNSMEKTWTGSCRNHIEKEGDRPEKFKWQTMNAMDELNSKLGDLMNGIKDVNQLNINYIDIINVSDCREGKFRLQSSLWDWLMEQFQVYSFTCWYSML